MSARSEILSTPVKETKSIIAEAAESADSFVDRVKDRAFDLQKQAGHYVEATEDYAQKHPWRIALTAAGIGVIAGALIFRRKS